MVHTTSTKVLLTTTLRPVVAQLSGALAQGVRLLDQFLHDELTPQKMATFEGELSSLWREVGRRIMAWVLNRRWCPSIACIKGLQRDAGRWLIESVDACQRALR